MFVACWLWFVVCCALLDVGSCELVFAVVCSALFSVRCLWFVVCCLLFPFLLIVSCSRLLVVDW